MCALAADLVNRGSTQTSLAPFSIALLIQRKEMGWFSAGLLPMIKMTSALAKSFQWLSSLPVRTTLPEPLPWGVSYPRLVFDVHQAQAAQEFLVDVAFLVVHRRAAHRGDGVRPVHRLAFFVLCMNEASRAVLMLLAILSSAHSQVTSSIPSSWAPVQGLGQAFELSESW